MIITEECFGEHENKPVTIFSINNGDITIKLLSLGAGICDVVMPDRYGYRDSVVLGFDYIDGYLKYNYIGSTIGRVCNRIAKGKFKLLNHDYELSINNNGNHLHGGTIGWDKHVWDGSIDGESVVFKLTSPDGEQGYPGTVQAKATYTLSSSGELNITYEAVADKATPINMTNHSFFNLAGHSSGSNGLLEHSAMIRADSYLPVSADLIPIGEQFPVEGTLFDLRSAVTLKEILSEMPNGFDHCFCLDGRTQDTKEAAVFLHHKSGRCLSVHTNEPSVQFYTGNFLPTSSTDMIGRVGVPYTKQGAFCCEPQSFPDAVNQPNFPKCILHPGETYKHAIVYHFYVKM